LSNVIDIPEPVSPDGAAMGFQAEHNRETEHTAAEARNFRKEAERIARDVFKRNGIHHPNKEQVRRLAQQPKVTRQAKRRLAVKGDL
jgi:hypothetical protein